MSLALAHEGLGVPRPLRRSEREVPVGGTLLTDLADGVPVHPRAMFLLTRGADFKRPALTDPSPLALVDLADGDELAPMTDATVPLADPLDIVIAREEAADRLAARRRVRELLRSLDPIERAVIRMRYGFGGEEPLGPGAIADRLGLCRKSAYNIEQRALARLAGDARAAEAHDVFAA